jgi:hypothetical protein
MIANRFPLMSCFVLEPLATGASHCHPGALRIIDAKLRAGVHAEVKLAQVAVKVFFVHVLVHTDQTSFENAEEASSVLV